MDKEVYQTQEFADYAKKNLVLVQADFPRKKAQSAAQKRANEALKEKYKVEGFPTLVTLNSEGRKVGEEVGYGGGGPKPLIATLEKYKNK